MKIVEIATGKAVDFEVWGTDDLVYKFADNKIYKIECCKRGFNLIDVSDKYRIVSDVRSKEEIEEEIKFYNKHDLKDSGTKMYVEALQWVLKESE